MAPCLQFGQWRQKHNSSRLSVRPSNFVGIIFFPSRHPFSLDPYSTTQFIYSLGLLLMRRPTFFPRVCSRHGSLPLARCPTQAWQPTLAQQTATVYSNAAALPRRRRTSGSTSAPPLTPRIHAVGGPCRAGRVRLLRGEHKRG